MLWRLERFAGRVEALPRQGPAFVPAGILRLGEQDFTLRIARHRWMLALALATWLQGEREGG